jgi:hypothetical protein
MQMRHDLCLCARQGGKGWKGVRRASDASFPCNTHVVFFSQRSTKAKLFATRKLSVFFSIWHQTISNRPAGGCECASHRDAARRTPIINRASAAGKKGICARAPKRNKTKLLMCAGLIQKIKRFQQIVAKVLRARRLNFLSAHAARGKLAASKKGSEFAEGRFYIWQS